MAIHMNMNCTISTPWLLKCMCRGLCVCVCVWVRGCVRFVQTCISVWVETAWRTLCAQRYFSSQHCDGDSLSFRAASLASVGHSKQRKCNSPALCKESPRWFPEKLQSTADRLIFSDLKWTWWLGRSSSPAAIKWQKQHLSHVIQIAPLLLHNENGLTEGYNNMM